MSLKVIELNDSGIVVGDKDGIIAQSPGFAFAAEDSLEIGEVAEQKARLQPTNSYNKYWHELSLEPISHGNINPLCPAIAISSALIRTSN